MRGAALVLFAAALAGCARPLPEARQESAQPTIVSLNPCSDAVLAEVAVPGQLLAISHYSHSAASSSMDLAEAARFRAVSGSAEEVLALHPDVVVADPFLAPATRAALARQGIRVVSLPIARSVGESRAQVLELARLAGNEEAGRALDRRIGAVLARAAAPSDHSGSIPATAIVWQGGGIVPGADTLIADLLSRTGYTLASAAQGMGQADHLPLEMLMAGPPRVLFVAGDARSEENRMLTHPALERLEGTKQVAFASSLLWCGGPTLVRAAERLAEARQEL